jgi:hypothetical protein
VELDERIARAIEENPGGSVKYLRQAALGEMALEIQDEMERKWSAVEEVNPEVIAIWHDAEALKAWVAEVGAITGDGTGE